MTSRVGVPIAPSEQAALIALGKEATRAGKKAQARYHFQRVLESDPNDPDALLWLAYLAGGGRPSLEYLVRLLEVDPTNQRARSAIRWARNRAQLQPVVSAAPPPARWPEWLQYLRTLSVMVAILAFGLVVGLATVAFVTEAPAPTPTRAQLIAFAFATPLSSPGAAPVEVERTVAASATAVPTRRPTLTLSPDSMYVLSPTALPTVTVALAATQPPTTAAPNPSVDTATPAPYPTAPIGDSFRWIDVDLTHQELIAYEGETPVRRVTVSTGLPRTPTVTGRFRIYVKFRTDDMSGPGYYLRNVPYVMYFYRGYGLHGTYWHNNFGQPMSHGCVNLPTPDAEWLFEWASVGTPVVVHN